MLFYEYFHGDNGAGLGASHQTGWTGLVARADPAVRLPRRPPRIGCSSSDRPMTAGHTAVVRASDAEAVRP